MKWICSAVVVVALITTACTSGTVSSSAVASDASGASTEATVSPSAAPTASPLEAMWTTGLLTCERQIAAIHDAGFTDAQITASSWGPCLASAYYRVRFLGDRLVAFGKSDEEPFSMASEYSYKQTDDHTLVLAEFGTQLVMTLRFTLVGNVLTFTSQSNNGDLNSQVALPAIFLSAPFTKGP
jgi:hypothetical protein